MKQLEDELVDLLSEFIEAKIQESMDVFLDSTIDNSTVESVKEKLRHKLMVLVNEAKTYREPPTLGPAPFPRPGPGVPYGPVFAQDSGQVYIRPIESYLMNSGGPR